jgi:histidinol-phosphatase
VTLFGAGKRTGTAAKFVSARSAGGREASALRVRERRSSDGHFEEASDRSSDCLPIVNSDLELALRLAALADGRTRAVRGTVRHRRKADGSVVTDVDLEIEREMTAALAAERPDDGILGEETGATPSLTGRQWIIDPIDGTADFVAGGQRWGTHVALSDRGTVTVAVMTRPKVNRRWWARAGCGAWTDTTAQSGPLRVSTVADLDRARVGGLVEPNSRDQRALRGRVVWSEDEVSVVAALIEGRIDAVVDDAGDPWDLAPATLLVAEAGGRFTDPAGGKRLDLGGALYSNALLHDEIGRLLTAARTGPED